MKEAYILAVLFDLILCILPISQTNYAVSSVQRIYSAFDELMVIYMYIQFELLISAESLLITVSSSQSHG